MIKLSPAFGIARPHRAVLLILQTLSVVSVPDALDHVFCCRGLIGFFPILLNWTHVLRDTFSNPLFP